jgi:hypothetical protein
MRLEFELLEAAKAVRALQAEVVALKRIKNHQGKHILKFEEDGWAKEKKEMLNENILLKEKMRQSELELKREK